MALDPMVQETEEQRRRRELARMIASRIGSPELATATNPAREAAGLPALEAPEPARPDVSGMARDIGNRVVDSLRPAVAGATNPAREAAGLPRLPEPGDEAPEEARDAEGDLTHEAAPQAAAQANAMRQSAVAPNQANQVPTSTGDASIGDARALKAAQAQSDEDSRRARRMGIAGAVLSAIGLTPIGAPLSAAASARAAGGQQRVSDLRGRIQADLEARQQRQQQERDQLRQAIEARQAQANRDRDFALRQQSADDMTAYRRAALEQRGAQYDRTQGFRESQAELDRDAAERRARIIAGQRIGPGGAPAGGAPSRPGGDRDVGGATANPDALIIQSIIDERGDQIRPAAEAEAARLRAEGIDANPDDIAWDMASGLFARLPRKEQNRIRTLYAAPPSTTSEAGRSDRMAESRRVESEGHRVPGWERSPDAPVLSASERGQARNIAASIANVDRFTRRMEQLSQQIGAIEATAGNARVLSERMAEARQIHEQLINELRTIGNYGVPQTAELQRMEALAPQLSSREFFVGSAPGIYRAMRSTLGQRAAGQMEALGYHRGGGSGGSGGARYRAGQTVTIRGRSVTLTEGQAAYLNQRAGGQ